MKKNKKGKYTFINTVDISTVLTKLYKIKKMKAKNLNRSSEKTRALIKAVFAEMLSEKKGIK